MRITFPSIIVLSLCVCCAGCSSKNDGPPAVGKTPESLCAHEVPQRFCPLCTPGVRNDPNILICKEHGNIPEDICTACHPELKKKYKACAEHSLPPAFCQACLAKSGKANPGDTRK